MNMVGNQGQVEEQGQPLPLKMILFKHVIKFAPYMCKCLFEFTPTSMTGLSLDKNRPAKRKRMLKNR